nr:MAG TPA: hypothetical protein [Bacteriophage sp.]
MRIFFYSLCYNNNISSFLDFVNTIFDFFKLMLKFVHII